MLYQLAHGRMSGERTRQLDYGKIAKTEVAERWFPFSEGIKGGGNPRKGVEMKKRDGNTLNGGTQQV